MKLLTTDTTSDGPIRHGDLITASAITGANVIRDMREAITNTLGGHMTRYEAVLDQTIDRAVASLRTKASAAGYDGVIGVKVSHPAIVDGAIEVVVIGTGFWFAREG